MSKIQQMEQEAKEHMVLIACLVGKLGGYTEVTHKELIEAEGMVMEISELKDTFAWAVEIKPTIPDTVDG